MQSYASETFLRHEDAWTWATATEHGIELGEVPLKRPEEIKRLPEYFECPPH